MSIKRPSSDAERPIIMTRGLTFLLALACGAIVANLYYSQTLIASIGHSLQLNLKLSGFIVTLTQFGYGAGLLFIAPLSDLVENRRLLIVLLALSFLSLLGIIFAETSLIFLLFCFLLGLTSGFGTSYYSLCSTHHPSRKARPSRRYGYERAVAGHHVVTSDGKPVHSFFFLGERFLYFQPLVCCY
ncbi:MAG: sugar transporter family protein [Gammaproteobacteria bacterium]|jgi:MFS family permease|nr:sugar transporter family protein [Gammaproteobacteria bacterium]